MFFQDSSSLCCVMSQELLMIILLTERRATSSSYDNACRCHPHFGKQLHFDAECCRLFTTSLFNDKHRFWSPGVSLFQFRSGERGRPRVISSRAILDLRDRGLATPFSRRLGPCEVPFPEFGTSVFENLSRLTRDCCSTHLRDRGLTTPFSRRLGPCEVPFREFVTSDFSSLARLTMKSFSVV